MDFLRSLLNQFLFLTTLRHFTIISQIASVCKNKLIIFSLFHAFQDIVTRITGDERTISKNLFQFLFCRWSTLLLADDDPKFPILIQVVIALLEYSMDNVFPCSNRRIG